MEFSMRKQGFEELHNISRFSAKGTGFLRVVLLFGSMALALGLVLIPILSDQTNTKLTQNLFQPNIDRSITGSIHASPIPQQESNDPTGRIQ